jgi:hypothetical protein
MKTLKNITIHITMNYDLFMVHPANPVSRVADAKLIKSFATKGWIENKPICVMESDGHPGRKIITDGHRRFFAAKQLGLPIHYVVDQREVPLSLPDHNGGDVIPWSKVTYILSFAQQKIKSYCDLVEFAKDYSLSINVALVIVDGRLSSIKEEIESGNWVCNTRAPYIQGVLRIMRAVRGDGDKPQRKFWNKRTFVGAVTLLAKYTDMDAQRMAARIKSRISTVENQADTKGFVDMLASIYDWKCVGEKSHLDNQLDKALDKARRERAAAALAKANKEAA